MNGKNIPAFVYPSELSMTSRNSSLVESCPKESVSSGCSEHLCLVWPGWPPLAHSLLDFLGATSRPKTQRPFCHCRGGALGNTSPTDQTHSTLSSAMRRLKKGKRKNSCVRLQHGCTRRGHRLSKMSLSPQDRHCNISPLWRVESSQKHRNWVEMVARDRGKGKWNWWF